MTDLAKLEHSLVAATDLEYDRLVALLGAGLAGVDDGELFLEYRETESLAFDDGRLKSAAFDTSNGFGLRGVAGEAIGYAHSRELTEAAIRRARAIRSRAASRRSRSGYSSRSLPMRAPRSRGSGR